MNWVISHMDDPGFPTQPLSLLKFIYLPKTTFCKAVHMIFLEEFDEQIIFCGVGFPL
ncbi:hypothetical protein LguiB_013283 [Lonicera macranthoides]